MATIITLIVWGIILTLALVAIGITIKNYKTDSDALGILCITLAAIMLCSLVFGICSWWGGFYEYGHGVTEGKVIQVSKEGSIFPTVELTILIGENKSFIKKYFTSTDMEMYDLLNANLGKNACIEYVEMARNPIWYGNGPILKNITIKKE